MKSNSKIGAFILTFNNQDTIAQCIYSVKNIVKQIVVVDSGSIDKTVQIATRLGAEVYFRRWTNDFGEQRNFALKHLRTEWALMVDSDEFLTQFDYDIFENIDRTIFYAGVNFRINNILENGKSSITHKYTRLFRQYDNIYFTGSIHEQIRPQIEQSGFDICDSNFEITHTGYSIISEEKLERNITMLENKLFTDGEDSFTLYHLANSYFTRGSIDESGEIYVKLLDKRDLSNEQLDMIYIRLSQIALKKDDYKSVINYTEIQPTDNDLSGLRNFMRAAAYLSMNDRASALELLEDEKTNNSNLVDKDLLSRTLELIK